MAATLSPDGRTRSADTAESVTIMVDGSALGEEWLGMLSDVQVRDNLLLPDTAVVRFRDPNGDHLTGHPLKLGAAMAIQLGADVDRAPEKLFEGEIVALEPEFRDDEAILAARAFDTGHRLNRTKESRTYLNKTATDIVREIAGRAGLPAGTIQSTATVHQHLQQSQETDWDLCWRLARMNGFEFAVNEGKVQFRERETGSAAATLKWKDSLLSFRPRASAVGQVEEVTVSSHDPKARQATTGTSSTAAAPGSAPIWRERASAISALSGGAAVVADRVATSTGEAQNLARGTLNRNASTFVEADGVAKGSPKLRAGATVALEGVGDFSGEYVLSGTVHVFRGGGAYTTRFEITGDRSRSFADLLAGPAPRADGGGGWGGKLVIAVVTNNNDPDAMGRVKVKFEALGSNIESDWARVTTLNAGKERGVFMLPQPGDEVVVGFELGDTRRPFVLGSLYTGVEPLPDDLKDGQGRKSKFGVKTDHQFLAHSEKELKLHSGEKLTIEVKGNPGDLNIDADGNVSEQVAKTRKLKAGQSLEVEANSSVKIKGTGSVEVESSGKVTIKGSMIEVSGSGMVNIKGATINLG